MWSCITVILRKKVFSFGKPSRSHFILLDLILLASSLDNVFGASHFWPWLTLTMYAIIIIKDPFLHPF